MLRVSVSVCNVPLSGVHRELAHRVTQDLRDLQVRVRPAEPVDQWSLPEVGEVPVSAGGVV